MGAERGGGVRVGGVRLYPGRMIGLHISLALFLLGIALARSGPFEIADKDGDGHVDKTEFSSYLKRVERALP